MSNYGLISTILKQKGGDVWSIAEEATVYQALKLMAEKNVGALLVTRESKPVGILSERDYARKVALKGKASKNVPVGEIISGKMITITARHTVEECMRLMSRQRVRHLPVLEEDKVVGVVSIGDLVTWIINTQSETINQLENYITGGDYQM